jgi:hemerythrin-like domain-containing protein
VANQPTDLNQDPFAELLRAHQDIEAHVSELERAADEAGDGTKSAAALATIGEVIAFFEGPGAIHQADEEQTLFPRLRPLATFAQMLAAFDFQHQLTDTTLAQLRTAFRGFSPGAAPKLRQVARQFAEMQRAHMMAEERALFPLAAQALPPEVIVHMREEMAARR